LTIRLAVRGAAIDAGLSLQPAATIADNPIAAQDLRRCIGLPRLEGNKQAATM
jgi:hypothetical protein